MTVRSLRVEGRRRRPVHRLKFLVACLLWPGEVHAVSRMFLRLGNVAREGIGNTILEIMRIPIPATSTVVAASVSVVAREGDSHLGSSWGRPTRSRESIWRIGDGGGMS